MFQGKTLYRVRWRGYGKESDTLEPEENLLSCKDMIEELEEKIKDKKRSKKEYKVQSLVSKSSVSMEIKSVKHTHVYVIKVCLFGTQDARLIYIYMCVIDINF